MNVADGHDQANRQTNFDYNMQGAHWSQVTPQYMPWGHTPAAPAAPLVTFTAQASAEAQLPSTSHVVDPRTTVARPSTSGMFVKSHLMSCFNVKRKAELHAPIRAAKQHVTEERMAAHMSRLHISSESGLGAEPGAAACPREAASSREQRLYMCEEMRRLQTVSILPHSLLGRLERPCMAVMLWQPPPKIRELLPPPARPQRAPLARVATPDQDNNNGCAADLNNMAMDT